MIAGLVVAYAMGFNGFPARIFWSPGHKIVERGPIIGLAVASAGLAHQTLPELYSPKRFDILLGTTIWRNALTMIIVLLGAAFWPQRGPVMHHPNPGAAVLRAWFRRQLSNGYGT